MKEKIRILGIGGSISPNSSTLQALRYALRGAEELGAETGLIDIASLNLPMYNHDYLEAPEGAEAMCEQVFQAHGLIWSSPMYHGTISGLFKNTIDWLELLSDREPKYLANKVVGLIASAGGVQGLQVINTMEYMVRSLRGWTCPLVVPVHRAWQIFDEDGSINDKIMEAQLLSLGREVFQASGKMSR
jgi:FMN reductase